MHHLLNALLKQSEVDSLTSDSDSVDTLSVPIWLGWLGVATAAAFFGSFGTLLKLPRVQRAQIHPLVFQQQIAVDM